MISFEEFQRLAAAYNVIPLTEKVFSDLHTPVSVYLAIRPQHGSSFLLESAEPSEKVGRFSYVGSNPIATIEERSGQTTIRRGKQIEKKQQNIFDSLEEMSRQYKSPPLDGAIPFSGGFVGYVGYECSTSIENIPIHEETGEEPGALFGLFETVIQFDHHTQVVTLSHNIVIDRNSPLEKQFQKGQQELARLRLQLRNMSFTSTGFSLLENDISSPDTKSDFVSAVETAKGHIREGDIFQVVLSRKSQTRFDGDLFQVYRALRTINPSPYLFFIDFGETKIVGSSPEVLVRVEGREVEVRPIAGTRRRGTSPAEDASLEEELRNDSKERAEHLMLVDLGRNDIGRVSELGSVSTTSFMHVERYSHVMHLVSEVRGKLREECTPIDVLKACFPAGTVTGAPKVRAMEIIHDLELERRGAYSGAVGYLGFDRSLNTCIAIRTIVAHRDVLKMQAGAGIVADSIPESEYTETENKSMVLLEALRLAANGLATPPSNREPKKLVVSKV